MSFYAIIVPVVITLLIGQGFLLSLLFELNPRDKVLRIGIFALCQFAFFAMSLGIAWLLALVGSAMAGNLIP